MQYSNSHFLFIILSIVITMSACLVTFYVSDFGGTDTGKNAAQNITNSKVVYNSFQKNENTVGVMTSPKNVFSIFDIGKTITENTFIKTANAAIELDDETLQGERPLLNVFLSGTNTDAGYVIQLKKSFIFKIEESLKNDPF
jgi:hypothetical protein